MEVLTWEMLLGVLNSHSRAVQLSEGHVLKYPPRPFRCPRVGPVGHVCVGALHQLQFQHKDWEVLWQLLVLGWALLLAFGRKRVRSSIRWLRNRCQTQLH